MKNLGWPVKHLKETGQRAKKKFQKLGEWNNGRFFRYFWYPRNECQVFLFTEQKSWNKKIVSSKILHDRDKKQANQQMAKIKSQ